MGDISSGEAGWGRLVNARKWHFLAPASTVSGRAGIGSVTLCGATVWMRAQDAPPLENEADNHEDNCATCKRRVQRNSYPAVDHA